MKKCIGCGFQLQMINQNQSGYVKNANNEFCLRCFRIKNYNDLIDQDIDHNVFLENIKNIVKKDKAPIFYYILDVFDLEGSRLLEIERIIGKKEVVIVVNKMDLLPKSVKLSKIRKYIKELFLTTGLKDSKIVLGSANKMDYIYPFLNIILDSSQNQYFIGASNVGKSSLINSLMKANNLIPQILESKFFNTTLDFIEIKLNSHTKIIDTPGIARKNSIANLMDKKDWKYCYFKNEIKQYTFQLNSDQTIFFEGLSWFSFESDKNIRQNFHVYVNKEVNLHRTKTINANLYWEKNKDVIVSLIDNETITEYEFNFSNEDIDKEYDISVSGLGWINFIVKEKQKIIFKVPSKKQSVLITKRLPII